MRLKALVSQLKTAGNTPEETERKEMEKIRLKWREYEKEEYWIEKVEQMSQIEALYEKNDLLLEYWRERKITEYTLAELEYKALKDIVENACDRKKRLEQLEKEQREGKRFLAALEGAWRAQEKLRKEGMP